MYVNCYGQELTIGIDRSYICSQFPLSYVIGVFFLDKWLFFHVLFIFKMR